MKFGLNDEIWIKITHIFIEFDEVKEVILYGSRAKGDYKQGSDIDLTIVGQDVNSKIVYRILEKLDDLMLPYTFDLSIYHQIGNAELTEHIKRVGKTVYKRSPDSIYCFVLSKD